MKLKLFTRRFYKNFKSIENDYIGKPTKYLEIGVFLGDTSQFMLDKILTHPDSRLVGIDPWKWFTPLHKRFPTEEIWKTKVLDRIDFLREHYSEKAKFIRGYSQNILMKNIWPKEYFDIVYIDGNHTIQSVLRDFVLSWPLLKIGGVMIFDDYLQGSSKQVNVAVNCILQGITSAKYDLLWKNYAVGIRKLAE